jgi:hypothetical protein
MFWTSVDLNGDADVSEAVNAQVARIHGDAIVHFKVMPDICLSVIPFFQLLLGFIPSCSYANFSGDIIRVLPADGQSSNRELGGTTSPPERPSASSSP